MTAPVGIRKNTPAKEIWISRNGKEYGPYGVDAVKEAIKRTTLDPADQFWAEGMSEWACLSDLDQVLARATNDGNASQSAQGTIQSGLADNLAGERLAGGPKERTSGVTKSPPVAANTNPETSEDRFAEKASQNGSNGEIVNAAEDTTKTGHTGADAPTEQGRLRGRVVRFREDFGFVEFKDRATGELKEVFVHISAVEDKNPLFRGEHIGFVLAEDRSGRLRAQEVTRLDKRERKRGKVVAWDEARGFGRIADQAGEIFAHYSEINASGPRILIIDEEVEYETRRGQRGTEAVRIRVFQSRFPIERFANIDRLRKDLLPKLAKMAMYEDWDYKNRDKGDRKFPVLENYVVYTLARVLAEEKIKVAADSTGEEFACANTGLVTELQQDIFAYFARNKYKGEPQKWQLQDFIEESDRRLGIFADMPETANYFTNPAELIYDPKRDLRLDVGHIIEDNINRFPESLRTNTFHLVNILEGAKEAALKRVQRNYKTAIPHFYKGKLQLLLPLCLSHANKAELALVVDREGEVYVGATVLPLDDAYNNARLIARPDREWLEP
jgi:cold shock CspA family protein